MRFELFNEQTNEIWKNVASGPAINRLQLELDIYKKLLNFFQIGDYYYVIFNLNLVELEFVSPEVEKLLGYSPNEFNMKTLLQALHPDDRPWLFNYEKIASHFLLSLPLDKLMKYKVRYDYRLKKKDGSYIRILHQSIIIEHDNQGHITRTLAVQTNITDLKREGKPLLSFIGLEGEKSYFDIGENGTSVATEEILSPREREVLLLLIEGKLSKQISKIFNISKNTVDNHRKNMLNKCNVATTAELVAKAIRNGWL